MTGTPAVWVVVSVSSEAPVGTTGLAHTTKAGALDEAEADVAAWFGLAVSDPGPHQDARRALDGADGGPYGEWTHDGDATWTLVRLEVRTP